MARKKRKLPDRLPGEEGWKPRRGLTFFTFEGGAADGQMVRWQEPYCPPFWNHVERKMAPVELEEDGLPPEGVALAGDMVVDGKRVFYEELRLWHRYQATVRVKGQAQVYAPVSGSPVPLAFDSVRGVWEDPADENWAARAAAWAATSAELEAQSGSIEVLSEPSGTLAPDADQDDDTQES